MIGSQHGSLACPCGTRRTYAACCAAYVDDGLPAPTAEALMRSRYTAYALRRPDHLFRTWHPATRPADIEPHGDLVWEGLQVREAEAGGSHDDEGTVDFVACWRLGDQRGAIEERSRFARRAGRWMYVGPQDERS
jgi:SEC-C motif-containing protein